MEGKELLKYFKKLPEHQQNKILVEAYKQIAILHDKGESFDSFTWRNCSLENDKLTIVADVDNYLNEEALQRNRLDYAGVVYCLVTGRSSAESMGWDAGRKIDSAVLREIVLTICGRNNSVGPLIEKLKQPYTDEESFFDGYSTVDEKEAADAYKKQQHIEQENQKAEQAERAKEIFSNSPYQQFPVYKPWYTKWWYFLIIFLIVGGVRACKQSKKIERQQIVKQQQMQFEQNKQLRRQLRNVHIDLGKEIKRNAPAKSNESDNLDE